MRGPKIKSRVCQLHLPNKKGKRKEMIIVIGGLLSLQYIQTTCVFVYYISLNIIILMPYPSFSFPLKFYEGLSQIKAKWSDYRSPKRLKRLVSLFVSLRGERVAVAAGNQITILQKDDDYQEPYGVFTSKIYSRFHGIMLLR